jgi:hypothetical protein
MFFSPEKQRKILIIFTSIFLIGGLALIIFAIFFNKAVLEVQLESPYEINLQNIRLVSCQNNPCSITIAPGIYQYEINKAGFLKKSGQIDLSLGQKLILTPELSPEPTLIPLGNWDEVIKKSSLNSLNYLISNNSPTGQPALFSENNPDQPLIYFLRNISKYQLFPSQNNVLIALLDQSDSQATSLYLLDLHAKSRKQLASGALLDFDWLEPKSAQPATTDLLNPQNFLIERRNPATQEIEIQFGTISSETTGSIQSNNLEILPVRSSLKAVASISSNEIIYPTPYSADSNYGFVIQKLNLKTRENQTIFSVDDLPLPARLEYDSNTSTVYLESEGTAYSLGPISTLN